MDEVKPQTLYQRRWRSTAGDADNANNLRRRRLATRALRWVRENRPDVIELLEQEMNDGQD